MLYLNIVHHEITDLLHV